jgi:hypothetical protein
VGEVPSGILPTVAHTRYSRLSIPVFGVTLSLRMKAIYRLIIFGILFAVSSIAEADGFTVEKTKAGVTVNYDGKLFTRYIIGQSNKPFLWPVIGPNGAEMTRAYPMEKREGERHDHPHHRSLWFGHQGVAGFDTWHEPMTILERGGNDAQKKQRLAGLGSTVHREFVKVQGGSTAVIITRNDYVGSNGKKLLADTRTHTFHVANGQRIIDVDITFTAEHGNCKLTDKKDAGFSVRVPTSIDVDSKKGGRIVNSNGITDKAAWSKRAEWVDYHGPVDGKTVGVAILNHPKSFRHPTAWHVRTYGLFTANPFSLRGLGLKGDGGLTLKKGESLTLRHRVIFHNGDEKTADIAGAYKAYAMEK